MKKILFFILSAVVITGFVGCNDDKKPKKIIPHPTEVIVTGGSQDYSLGYYVATNKTGLPTKFISLTAEVKDLVTGQTIQGAAVTWRCYGSSYGKGNFVPNPAAFTVYEPVLDSSPTTVYAYARYEGSTKYEADERDITIKQNY